jgi:hypothetical protein
MQTASNEVITSTYATQVSPTGRAPSNEGGIREGWIDGLPLVLSVTLGGPVPVSTITLGGLMVLGDGADFADLVAAPNDELVINIDLSGVSDLACQKSGMYLVASLTIDASGASFSGIVSSTCANNGRYVWRGWSTEGAASIRAQQIHRVLMSHLAKQKEMN